MGSYLNPGSFSFRGSLRSKIYVDKSELIAKINEVLYTEQKYICVSRPRRFGKSMAANMLAAYYDRSENTEELFQNLMISKDSSYRENLNQYDVIKINMQEFFSLSGTIEEMLQMLRDYLLSDFKEAYHEVHFRDEKNLIQVMKDVFSYTKCPFVILIDEWDCLFREYKQDKEAQKKYLDFLRVWLKDKDYVALAYMTGILPIKKYGSHSALNMFTEYSMTNPREMAEYFGFTEEEVEKLCQRFDRNFEETHAWYDGYELVKIDGKEKVYYSMYSPKPVVDAMLSGVFDNYWNQTETYEALKAYIKLNFDGLKDAVIHMLAGERVQINTGTFSNDMTSFQGKDDVLTLLIHLGYLSYHWPDKTVTIPNKEVSQEYINAISTMDWSEVTASIEDSRMLLEALWNMDGKAVAEGIDKAHQEISILQYNNENSLSCTIHLAFYFAREYYTMVRELPTGKGFADVCFIPRKIHLDKPAVIIELKWDKSAKGAINQIKGKHYVEALKDYQGKLLLAGINYDKTTKRHNCMIEQFRLNKIIDRQNIENK
nr:AAA family ATPase [uncultured Anaerobutyricum sp.]